MNALALSEPCGVCACCRVGGRCARMLLLDAKDLRALAKVNAIAGEITGRVVDLKIKRDANGFARKTEDEPTITVTCPRCDEDYELLAYVANTLKLRGVPIPPCEGCKYPDSERADLR